MILSALSFKAFAVDFNSELSLPGFKEAGFKVQPLVAFKPESENSFHNNLVNFYKDSGEFAKRVFVVTDYPKALGKTEVNYAPPRSKIPETENLIPFETVVLSRYNGTDDTHLPKILTSWIETGFSSHAVVTLDGTIVYWVDPILCKGQMAGTWNKCSVEVLVATDVGQRLVDIQVGSLKSIVDFANAFVNAGKEKIQYMLSHGEARGSKSEGTIVDIDAVRETLVLSNTIVINK